MTDASHAEKSIRLFFQDFARHLEKIRDGTHTANPVQRAHIMLGQLQEFERACVKEFGRATVESSDRVAASDLIKARDLDAFIDWLTQRQTWAPVESAFVLTSNRSWERVTGSDPFPRLDFREWADNRLVGHKEDRDRLFVFLHVFGDPRVILGFPSRGSDFKENAMELASFAAKLLPLFVSGPILTSAHIPGVTPPLIGRDAKFLELLSLVEKAAVTDVTILLEGESGTGKEIIADFCHSRSPRHDQKLVAVNCAAIPAGLMESELFGHEKGAFTGAYSRQMGRIEEANKGTLFLDEVGEMDVPLQAKLLRFLQLHEFHRVGGKQKIKVDVRIIAASNRNLKQHVADGLFRDDLYYRLSVMPFTVPPLRDRVQDITPLAKHFFDKYAADFGFGRKEIDPMVFHLLSHYPFPGNVRELENIVQNMLILAGDGKIRPGHLPEAVRGCEPKGDIHFAASEKARSFIRRRTAHKVLNKQALTRKASGPTAPFPQETPETNAQLKVAKQRIQDHANELTLEVERRFLKHLLDRAGGSMVKAAKLGGINRTLLYKLANRTKDSDEGLPPSDDKAPRDAGS